MIIYKKDGWPNEEHPSEIYLYLIQDECRAGRIVILKDKIYYDEITIKTFEDLDQWIEILKLAWQMKIMQDKKGWNKR